MKIMLFLSFIGPIVAFAAPQKINGLYVNTFGESTRPALVFVHGGPGYNSYDFEFTTAKRLADKGYFVVVYDQRGQGRSDAASSPLNYSYLNYAKDLSELISALNLHDPILIGHSHGGAIALKFDEFVPGVAKRIILVSAPVNVWGSMMALYRNCTDKFARVGRFDFVDRMTKSYTQLELNSAVTEREREDAVEEAFKEGVACGAYSATQLTPEALKIWLLLNDNPIRGPLTGELESMPGFLKNENYIRLNLFDLVRKNRKRYYGIFGEEDGLFDRLQLNVLKLSLAGGHFGLVSRASHYIYIDQQDAFLNAVDEFSR